MLDLLDALEPDRDLGQSLVRRSREAGPQAVEFDPELADGFAARGYVRAMLDHEWAGAEQDRTWRYQRARTNTPSLLQVVTRSGLPSPVTSPTDNARLSTCPPIEPVERA